MREKSSRTWVLLELAVANEHAADAKVLQLQADLWQRLAEELGRAADVLDLRHDVLACCGLLANE